MKRSATFLVAGIFFTGTGGAWAQNTPAPPTPSVASKADTKPVTRPTVTIETAKGKIVIELYPEDAPITVQNFVTLAKSGFYNGLTFHRVEPGFVIQGGDPRGNGSGGPGYFIKNENNKVLKHEVGAVAMANAGRDTAGSQFYVVITKPAPFLDAKYPDDVNKYTLFGKVVSGQDVAEKIAVGDAMSAVSVALPMPGTEPKAAPAPESKITTVATATGFVPVIVPYLDKPLVPKSTKPRVRVSVSPEGKVTKVKMLTNTGVKELDRAVTDALSQWQWTAAMKNGKTVASDRTFVYDIINRSVRYD